MEVFPRKRRAASAVLLTLLVLGGACGKSTNKSSNPPTLPAGTYTVSQPSCVSSSQNLTFSSPESAAAFQAFDNLTSVTYEVLQNGSTVVIYETPDCRLRVTRGIALNQDGIFSFSLSRTHLFEPSACSPTVTIDGETVTLDPSSPAFADSDSAEEDIRWQRYVEGGSSTFRTLGFEPFSSAWVPYGCANPDQLQLEILHQK